MKWPRAEDATHYYSMGLDLDLDRAMREAMVTIARAGLVVPRVSSKFVQPAFVFSVAPRTQDSKPN